MLYMWYTHYRAIHSPARYPSRPLAKFWSQPYIQRWVHDVSCLSIEHSPPKLSLFWRNKSTQQINFHFCCTSLGRVMRTLPYNLPIVYEEYMSVLLLLSITWKHCWLSKPPFMFNRFLSWSELSRHTLGISVNLLPRIRSKCMFERMLKLSCILFLKCFWK